jgi:hypothetical protein
MQIGRKARAQLPKDCFPGFFWPCYKRRNVSHDPSNRRDPLKRFEQVIDAVDKERIRVGKENHFGVGFDPESVEHGGVMSYRESS